MYEENKDVKFGGIWSPPNCQARHKVSHFSGPLIIIFSPSSICS